MLTAEADRFLTADLVEWLADLLVDDQLRNDTPKSRLNGLRSAVLHRLTMNEELGLLHFDDGLEHNPLPLRTQDGGRVVLVTSRDEDLTVEDVEFVDWARDSDCVRCAAALQHWQPPRFDPSLPVVTVGGTHIAYGHPERAGMTPEQILRRLYPALRTANQERLGWDETVVPAYWYPATRSWVFVVPLGLDPDAAPVAGVLVPGVDGYHLVTILTRRTAFWNLASLGQAPPAWLDGDEPDG